MKHVIVGIRLASLSQPFKTAVRTAARLGADAVEIDARGELAPRELSATGLREVRRLLEELELGVSAVGFRTRRGYDEADDLDRRIEATKGALRFAHAVGARVVVNHFGRVPDEAVGPSWNLLVESLSELGAFGIHVGATLAGQTGTESGADLARLLAALPEGGIGVNFDPAELMMHGHSPNEAVQALARRIVHVHARDAVRDFALRRTVETALGRGTADWPALLAALEEHGYRGALTVARDQADDAPLEIAAAVKYLRSLMTM